MFKNFGKRALSLVLAVTTVFTLLPVMPFVSLLPEVTQEQAVQAHAKTVNVLDGQISVTDTSGNASLSNGVVTTTIKGSLLSKKTNTVTIANESQSKATLKFDYTASTYNSFKIAGASASATGTYSALLDPGASVVLTIQSNSGLSNLTATLKLSNFSLTAAAASSNITFQYDSTLGSVSVEDTAVANGASASFTADGKTIKATPVNGATFIGWVYEDGKVLSREPGYHFAPSGDTTIKAVFVNSSSPAYFFAGSTYLLSDLNAAANIAAGASKKTVILMNSATLPAGDYTIPSGVTLLIPYNDAHTLCTTAPSIATADGFETLPDISAYRTLTMATGAHITVNGAISVSGTQHAGGRYCGNTRGPLGYIKMNTGSSITINSGAFLYAWGYIIGDGTVTGKSGATVYESFQITDWRGGSVTSKVAQDTQGVFPMCQYFVQNIEVPMTLEAGAKEFAFMSVNISLVGVQDSAVPFIGDSNSGAMFRVAQGSVTKKYDGTTDRLIVSANGQVSIEPLKMSMKLGLIGETELDSAKFNLPITNNMTVVAEAGTMTINQNVAVLPGAQVIVKKDATCVLGSGKSIVVYDSQVWGNYVGSTNLKFKILPHAPGRTYTRTEADLVDAYIQIDGTMDASKGYLYTTTGGANIVSTGGGTIIMRPGTAAHTYQMTQGEDDVTYVEVPVTSAMLKNGNGNFVPTSVSEGTFTYDAATGKWIKDPCDHVYEETITKQPGCTTEGTKVFTCKDAACGHSYTQAIAATGHTPGDEATCTTAQTCTKCAEELTPAKGHTAGDEATCTTAQTCAECGEQLTPAKGHTPGPDAACTTAQTCTVCGAEIAPANGHNYTAAVTAPTCTEQGYTTHTCSACGDSYVDTYVAAAGHTEGTEATCETAQICTVCNAVLTEALGHDEVNHDACAETCVEIGWGAYVTCTRCDYTTKQEIPAKGHAYTGVVTTNPTCTEKGEKTYICSNCSDQYMEEVAALGHNMVHQAEQEATCTQPGVSAGSVCGRCGYTEDRGAIPALGHNWVLSTREEATCTVDGKIVYVCDRTECDEENASKVEILVAKGHILTEVAAKAATCTEIGWDAYETCEKCEYTTYVEIPATGHSIVHHDAKEATCTAIGWNAYETCEKCEYTTYAEIPATGHSIVHHDAKDATCTAIGWNAYETCEKCEYTTYVEIPATGHSIVHHDAKDATCTEIGWDAYEYCVRCDYTTYSERPIKEHTYTAVVTPPTCSVSGYTTHTCSGCSHSYVDSQVSPVGHDMAPATCTKPSTCKNGCGLTEGLPLGHKIVVDEEVQALCEDSGLTEGSHCGVCGEVLVHQQVIPALGHKILYFDAKKPTYTGVGWNAYEKCSRCAHSTYVEIPALGLPTIWYYDTFMENLALLEELAENYVAQHPGKDPAALVIKYIRTGVERYNSGSWGMMAGYEDADFARYVSEVEDAFNSAAQSESEMLMVSGLKNIKHFYLPNGDYVDFGHMFGMMDITYHNRFSVNHADVAGWAGDLVDLLSLTDQFGVSGTLDEMIADISANYLLKTEFQETPLEGSFGVTDMYADLDGFYIMDRLSKVQYESGKLCEIFREYFAETLTTEHRISYFLENRLDGVTLRGDIRTAVYNAYTGNKVIATLEGTRNFTSSDLMTLKKACCYAFADYLCRIAGDYVESTENNYYDVFSSESSTLAPGITQKIQFATSADGKQMAYYLATADLTREDVHIFANYNNNDPGAGWAMQRVLDQANAAQKKYGDPSSPNYVPNYNVIASINGAGYNMETGEPGGVLVMNGVEYHPVNGNGFFGILKDGTPVIGTTEEYNTIYQGQVQEAIAGFGAVLIKDGQIQITKSDNHLIDRASRTAIGITKTGKVVFMVLDGRQEPFSCGGSMEEIAQIMLEAGCVNAINLDGGGSSTYVAKQEGEDALRVISRPSDGSARSVSTSLILVSTAPNSKEFDHAILNAKTNYLTVGSSLQIKAEGVSATGNSAIIPEGATWAVSDTRWGTITEDGVFTALRNGDVDVYLMLGDEVIGSVTLHVVIPNNIYFTKDKIDAVYGEKVELPVKALYDGKEVTVRAEDLKFTLEAPTAGTINGFIFIGSEASKIRSTKVTVSLTHNDTAVASAYVSLYYQGETSFDFEQAVGGDRLLAWDRVVSNSTTHDAITYDVINPGEDMVTSYIFAIDMMQIPVPKQLEDLIYMLPGSDMAGASAWTLLLQLAQRVSVLTEVKPVIHFDSNFNVDYSNLTLVNDYLELREVDFDEASNSLTLTLKWKKQTHAVDPNVANPICILSGIKLTPKENAQWSEKGSLTAVHGGKVSYTIYLRATSLYTFAQKPENQATYGLLPFVNPDDRSETGASFGDTYKEFQDTYTLVRVMKNGWVNEEGGFAYYVDGEPCYGIHKIDGLYYDFGQSGINIGQTPYTGLMISDGNTYFVKLGQIAKGWYTIEDVWYLFDWHTGIGVNGTYQTTIDNVKVTYEFDNGKLLKGFWHKTDAGIQYFYGPHYYKQGWRVIDGKTYFFEEYYAKTGVVPVRPAHAVNATWYEFSETGELVAEAQDGLYWHNGNLYYVVDAQSTHTGVYFIDGQYYYFRSNYTAVVGQNWWVGNTNGLIPSGTYRFDEQGRAIMTTEIVNEDGTLYYYQNGVRVNNAGVVKFGNDYYCVGSGAIAYVNCATWVSKTNGLLPEGTYRFTADGKMVMTTEVVNENGTLYYYADGKRTAGAGLILFDGHYYFIDGAAKAVTNTTVWVEKTNDLKAKGTYTFDAEGKMIILNGIVDGYYYVESVKVFAGLLFMDGYYYYAADGGQIVVNQPVWITMHNGLLPEGTYRFDADGRAIMTTEIVNEKGTLYYYHNGKRTNNAGVVQFGDDYYCVGSGAIVFVGGTFWISKTNGLLPEGTYRFDADGKIIMTTEIVNENGTLYYYENGRRVGNAGLLQIDGNYYYVDSGAIVAANGPAWVAKTNDLLPEGTYRFAADGKMILTTEVVNENDTFYYYYNGKRVSNVGVVLFNGHYYFIDVGAKAVVSKTIWVNKTNDLVPEGAYTFDAEGKMYLHNQILNGYYYYEGKKTDAGLVLINGAYFYADVGGKIQVNKIFWVSKTNDLLPAGTYRFDANGQAIMTTEIVNENGTLYYYQEGKRTGDAGVLKINGGYYYVGSGAIVPSNCSSWVSNTNGLLPEGTYRFTAEGRMIMTTDVVNEDGTLYYYEDGRRVSNPGLVLLNGDYYFIDVGAKAVVNKTIWVNRTNGLAEEGRYTFGADGKMVVANGIENGYYYVNGARTYAGLIQIDGNYYYADWDGKIIVNQPFWISKDNGLLPVGTYRFDANGQAIMTTEIVNENGTLYYYQDGKRTGNVGVLEINGGYYYVGSGAIVPSNCSSWVDNTNDLVPVGTYRFDAEGKMIFTTDVVNEDGTLYYYEDGRRVSNPGLVLINGDYYFIDVGAKAVVNKTIWINRTNGILPEGRYTFDKDGKLIL